jgi:thiamine transport system substrate-binding protein
MNRTVAGILCAAIVPWLIVAMGCTSQEKATAPSTLTVMTHDSFKVSAQVVRDFEQAQGCRVVILKAGDAGAALNQAILSRNNPLADVFYGVDNTFMGRALKGDIFVPYGSPMLKDIAEGLDLDGSHRLLPVDYGDVCLNYDKAWFARKNITPPSSLEDLATPSYRDLLVVENPATSSPGLAFLLATIGRFGEDAYLDFWLKLKANGVLVTSGWEEAYWGQFSAASKGDRPIVVSYASSPPAEVYYSKKPLDEAPTAAVVTPGTAFRQVEFVGILKGTKNPGLARKFVDYALDIRFQEDIPLQMFVFPANRRARLPEVFRKHAAVAVDPVAMDPGVITLKREAWIEAWTEAVLR